MFLVFNKEKVCAYIVSIITVCFLFFIAGVTTGDSIQTSVNTTSINENISNVSNTRTNRN